MRRALLVCVAACWSAPPQVPATGTPGLLWETARQPWRMAQQLTTLAVDGDTAIVGGAGGWVARIDLRTGVIVDEQRLGDGFVLFDLAHLRDGRWVVVGNDRGVTRAVALDADTLAPHPIPLGVVPDRHQIHAGVAVTADGGVVIAGKGLPLAIYDPQTWKIRTVLAAELGWNRPRVVGSTLAIELDTTAYGFDLASHTRTELGPSATVVATSPRVALKVFDQGSWWAEIWEHDRKLVRLVAPVDAVTLSDDGKRLAVARGTRVAIYGEPFTETSDTIELGPSAASGVVGMTLTTTRLLVSTRAILRAIDLSRRVVSSPGAPPWGPPIALGVGAGGTVLDAREGHAWWLANGRVTGEAALGGFVPGAIRPDEIARIVGRDGAAIAVRDRANREIGRWLPNPVAVGAWLGARGDVAIATQPARTAGLLLTDGVKLVPGLGFTSEGDVRDVDPDSGDALIAAGGRVWVANVRTGRGWSHPLVVPGCATDGGATLERNGTRAATFAGRDVALWERTTGAPIASARFGSTVNRVIVDHDEVIVVALPSLVFWRPGTAPRVLGFVDLYTATADATHVALAFEDGRVALLDRAAARAAATPIELEPAALPAKCPIIDPFDLPHDVTD